MKLYIIANRLPVKAVSGKGGFTFTRSEGGLATGLDSLHTKLEKHWIGWPGVCTDNPDEQADIRGELAEMDFHPVFIPENRYHDYYEGYCNSTLWPLCHYFFSYTQISSDFLESYRAVNRLFCEEVCKLVGPDDWVWVQDYQLMLLPGMLRKERPLLHIGYFHHIPFPSYELFRILPERAELLEGLLGADFVAFHTYDYVRHFVSAVERVLQLKFNLDEVQVGNRIVRTDALPMGINFELYHRASQSSKVWKEVEKYQLLFGKHKMILSVDRLDYSKGILHRLEGYAKFLARHPEYCSKVTLAMVIVPSRDHVGSYSDLKTKIDEKISEINGVYSTMDWTPVCYFYHGFSFEELAAMYFVADIALVTPLRDGMNLVAKEYVATKVNNPGVLILSEMAGAAAELTDALMINPNDTGQIADAIYEALTMPYEEQLRRMVHMQSVISVYTVDKWAADFMDEWESTADKSALLRQKIITPNLAKQIKEQYDGSHNRLIMLDYDGTLVGFKNRPEDACPTPELMDTLSRLCSDPRNKVVISSGREQRDLEKWFGKLPLELAAEHGACFKEHGTWHRNTPSKPQSEGIMAILKMFVAKTPHSHIELKDNAIAWHYREADPWLGELRAQQLMRALYSICMHQGLQIMPGNKVVEIKSPQYTKGTEAKRLLQGEPYDFVMAIGDDTTDEDMFDMLPESAITVKVGMASEYARYDIGRQADVLPFINGIIGEGGFDGLGEVHGSSAIGRILGGIKKFFGLSKGDDGMGRGIASKI